MARKLILEIVADPRQAQRGFNQASRSARGFERDLDKATRGALAGSGVFKALGRSLAFASGGFLAFATVGGFLRKSIDAAKEAQVTQKQLAAQFRASGRDVRDYQEAIEKTANRLSLLAGFENDELKAAFTTIFRTTGSVRKALTDTALAADLVRAKHLGLAQAALIVAKTEAGNTTLLRRQGFQIAKNATAEQALAKLRQVVAGQARAGTTAQERFGAVLHNTEEIIGTALLPTLNKYLNSLAHWLTRMNESGRLQRDVAEATKTIGEAIAGVRAVLTPFIRGFRLLGDAVGGTRREIELLTTAFILLRTRAALIKWGLISSQITGIGVAAEGAAGRVGLLRARLLSLKTLGPIAITVAVNEIIKRTTGADPLGKALSLGDATARDQIVVIDGVTYIKGSIGELRARQRQQARRRFGINAGTNLFGLGGPTVQTATRSTAPFTLTPAQRRAINLSGEPTLAALRAQRDFDKAQIAALQKRFDAGKVGAKSFAAAMIRLRNDLAQQESAITSIIEERAQLAREQAKAAADKARKALQLAAENASIFLQSISRGVKLGVDVKKAGAGVGQFVVPIQLQIAQARAEALGLNDEKIKPILLRIKKAAQTALASGRLAGLAQIDAWNTIGQINDQLKNQSGRIIGKFKHVDPNKLLAGLDLTAAQRRTLAPAIAQIGFQGRVPAVTPRVFARPDVVVHTHISLDGREIAQNTTRHQRKDSQRRAVSRRGPYAGRH